MKDSLTLRNRRPIVDFEMTLDELLEDWRTKNGFSYSQAAERCGISPSLWTRIRKRERLNLYTESWLSISAATGYTTDTLMVAARNSSKAIDRDLAVVSA